MRWLTSAWDVWCQVSGWISLPVIGAFFGDQSYRLLRETSWDGEVPVKEDPVTGTPQVAPMGSTNLAFELFTMMNPNAPTSTNGPVTINQQPGAPGLTINGQPVQPFQADVPPFGQPPSFTINGGNVNIGGSTINIGGTTWNQPPTTINIGGNTTINIPGQPPIVIPPLPPFPVSPAPPPGAPQPPVPTPPPKPQTSVFMGQVISGGGTQYTMNCLGKGPVQVTVPQIASGLTIPTGMWGVVVGVPKDSDKLGAADFDYYFQPPVWVN